MYAIFRGNYVQGMCPDSSASVSFVKNARYHVYMPASDLLSDIANLLKHALQF